MDAPRTRKTIREQVLSDIEYIFDHGSIGTDDYRRLDALAYEFANLAADIQTARQRRGR